VTIRVLKNRPFARWANSEGLTERALCVAGHEIEIGLVDARLGGFLLKKRVAKDHKGKSGGFRTIVAHRQGSRLIFLYGFAKRDLANIDNVEEKALRKLADVYISKSNAQIDELIKEGRLVEVHCDDGQ
jgi:hypothetical protein